MDAALWIYIYSRKNPIKSWISFTSGRQISLLFEGRFKTLGRRQTICCAVLVSLLHRYIDKNTIHFLGKLQGISRGPVTTKDIVKQ